MRYKDYKIRRFHQCNAKEYEYELLDGKKQIEFWSYSTPMIIRCDGKVYMNNERYSRTTSAQVNKYCYENDIRTGNAEYRTEKELRSMCM